MGLLERTLARRDFAAIVGASLAAGALSGCGGRVTAPPVLDRRPSFAGATSAIRAAIARDAADAAILPAALPRLYEHGKAVKHAVVLFHGFTNCPQQFDELARAYHARGCNVYVPRLPRHGLKDRLTRALADVTVADYQRSAEDAFVSARGLGTSVSAVGLSLGASMVLWLAQTQPIDLAVPIAPFLMPVTPGSVHVPIPSAVGNPAMRALYTLPSMYWWWDPGVKLSSRPVYAYPGYPTHALAELVFLGNAVFAQASNAAPRGRRCFLVLNEHDNAVDNAVARKLLATWNRRGARYDELVLTGLGGPRHDIIDPTTYPAGRTLVYPKLEELVLR
jgi:Alpha/beta hydrolase family